MNLTVAVIGMTVGIAAFLGLVDGTLDRIIKPLIGG
jgi:preprotein translocase subunit SecE